MIYFDSDMSKSTNTVVHFDWKTVIYIYGIFKKYLLRKVNKGNNKITELRTILQRESQNS